MPKSLDQCKVGGVADDEQPLQSSTDPANISFRPFNGDCRKKLQPPGGCLPATLAHDDQTQKMEARARQHWSDPCAPALKTPKICVIWASLGEPLRLKFAYCENKKEKLGLQRDCRFLIVVGAQTSWQSVECLN